MNKPNPDIVTWIIEDNAAFRSNLAETLNDTQNIRCRRDFSSCEEAIHYLTICTTIPDLIIIDLSLPKMTGIEGILQMKASHPDIYHTQCLS